MGSDDLFKRQRREKRDRKENNKKLAPYRYLIVCEGEKTEPNYFKGIRKYMEASYVDKIRVEQKITLDVEGTGRNTNDLVNYVSLLRNKANIPYGHIWVIFDKDDFRPDQFNSAIEQARAQGYHVGWSNEAIELWFILHFENLTSGISRDQYCNKLTEIFRDKIGKGYGKNMEDIFDILKTHGSIDLAIKRGINLFKMHEEIGNFNPAKMKPATSVYQLINELKCYFN